MEWNGVDEYEQTLIIRGFVELITAFFNPFSPTLFLIVVTMSLQKRSAPYWSNPPFLIF